MRPSNGSLPARDAYRALLQPARQRRLLSSTALYPHYTWSASSSASSSSSCPTPSSSTFSAHKLISKSKAPKRLGSLFASAYSTSNPAYPLPGSNNEIDPRGVDYSLFETEDDDYIQYASPSTAHKSTSGSHQFDASATVRSSSTLSAPSQLLVRLINDKDFESATAVLQELRTLGTPVDQLLPIYSSAALWAIRNGKKAEMLKWMELCPGYVPGSKYLETSSNARFAKQAWSVANDFQKCFVVLLDLYADDLRLLQRASMIAAEKGYWTVLQATLAHILRFGLGRSPDTDQSNPALAWQYFQNLLRAHQSQRGLREETRRESIKSAAVELCALYNLGVRTLALAGRLDDAVHWAEKSIHVNGASRSTSRIVRLNAFTEKQLIEQLVKAGPDHYDQAHSLARALADNPTRNAKHKPVDVDSIIGSIVREASFQNSQDDEVGAASKLDAAIQVQLLHGDIVAARDHLLTTLRSATRIYRDEDDYSSTNATTSGDSIFSHLPSARTLADLQDHANKLGSVVVTNSASEAEPQQLHGQYGQEPSIPQQTLTAEEFLSPIRAQLYHVRGGRGLWETARLYSYVKKGRFKDAIRFYLGKSGFRIPAGGITIKLISLATDEQVQPKRDPGKLDFSQAHRGKHWPSTHAINLMLKAIVGICIDAKDYNRLRQVYDMWKQASLSSASFKFSGDTGEATEDDALDFQAWPPSQRPDSFTVDPFVRAFGRLTVELESTASDQNIAAASRHKVENEAWGSSQAVLDVIRDMTALFHIRPSISTWTIALECLAREGPSRWESTTEILARAVGINTVSPLVSSAQHAVTAPQPEFPPATLATYTALIHALIRVSHQHGGSQIDKAATVRDDLLVRTLDLDSVVRTLVLAEKEEAEEGGRFWSDLLDRWQAVQQAVEGRCENDTRKRWDAGEVISANQGRTIEALRELWMLETARVEAEAASAAMY